MDEQGDTSVYDSAAVHEKVVRILKSRKSRSRKAELIVAILLGFWDIVGREQDAGRDRPFDLRDDDGGVRIDVKTQRGGVLDVKKEKVAKQFLAWSRSGGFLPMQVVLDSKTQGWYVVAGIPTAARTALDPLDTQFDPEDPGKPFCVGKCLLEELADPVRCEAMRGKLKKGVEDVKANGAAVRQKVSRGQQEYLETLTELLLLDRMPAVVRSVGSSAQAMNELGQIDEAMQKLAQSDTAMQKLAQSDTAMQKLAQSDTAMLKILGPEMFAIWKERQNKPAE